MGGDVSWMREAESVIVIVPGSRLTREGLLMKMEESVRVRKKIRNEYKFLTYETE